MIKELGCTANPDFASALLKLRKTVEDLKRRRLEVANVLVNKNKLFTQESNASSLEREARGVQNFVINILHNIKPNFFAIGANEAQARELLREHENVLRNIEGVEVTVSHIEQGFRQLQAAAGAQNASPGRADRTFKSMQDEWKHLQFVVKERSLMLEAAVVFHEKHGKVSEPNMSADRAFSSRTAPTIGCGRWRRT